MTKQICGQLWYAYSAFRWGINPKTYPNNDVVIMLMLVTVNPIKINPSSKTAARATRQSIPNPKTTEKAK